MLFIFNGKRKFLGDKFVVILKVFYFLNHYLSLKFFMIYYKQPK